MKFVGSYNPNQCTVPLPFGSVMQGRAYSSAAYRYGFNGKENDTETNCYDYGFRIYNSSLCRFLSIDPLIQSFPWYTPFQFAGNKPILAVDLDGLEEYISNGALTKLPGYVLALEVAKCVDVPMNNQGVNMDGLIKKNITKQIVDVYFVPFNGNETGLHGVTLKSLITNDEELKAAQSLEMDLGEGSNSKKMKPFKHAQSEDLKNSFAKGHKVLIIAIDVSEIVNFGHLSNSSDKATSDKAYSGVAHVAETIVHETFSHASDILVDGIVNSTESADHEKYHGTPGGISPSYDKIKTEDKYKNTIARKVIRQIEAEIQCIKDKKDK